MKLSSVVMVLLTKVLIGELTEALNVTVTPGPVSVCLEGENITMSCLISQRKRSSSVLVLRWLYFPKPEDERLVVKMNFKKTKYYGNYSLSFSQTKFYLWEETEGEVYSLLIVNVSREDGGNYSCKVQEIRKHRNKWRASSNGTGGMELRELVEKTSYTQQLDLLYSSSSNSNSSSHVDSCTRVEPVINAVHYLGVPESTDNIWLWFQDLYLCAVLICSVGLVSTLLFIMKITCQYMWHSQRRKARFYLVKCPESSSGETVTSVASSSPGIHRKAKRHKASPKNITAQPPVIPVKAPVPRKPRRTKLLKVQPRKSHMPRVADDSLTYAELELVKRAPEAKRSSLGTAQLETNAQSTGTVYAQILFVEKQV